MGRHDIKRSRAQWIERNGMGHIREEYEWIGPEYNILMLYAEECNRIKVYVMKVYSRVEHNKIERLELY